MAGWRGFTAAGAGLRGGSTCAGAERRQDAPADGLAMGYARLSAGRTSIIIDAAPPPTGRASVNAHASTLAFELTSGRRPLIVNCGSGVSFGAEWRRAGRATPSHSTLVVGAHPARGWDRGGEARSWLTDAPRNVPVEISHAPDGLRFEGGHDGYLRSHGLTHARTLELTFDGRGVAGEDMLLTLAEATSAASTGRWMRPACRASPSTSVFTCTRMWMPPRHGRRGGVDGAQERGNLGVSHDGRAEIVA